VSELAGDARGDAVTPSDEPAARWRDLFSGPSGLQMAVSAGGIALHSTTLYITTSILPSVVADMGGMPLYAWNTTVFVVAAIVGAAAAVQVLQRLGVRWAYISAAAAFAAGSALCALAPSMPVMLLGRLIQGLAGGALLAGPYVLVQQALPARLWPRALALFSGMWGSPRCSVRPLAACWHSMRTGASRSGRSLWWPWRWPWVQQRRLGAPSLTPWRRRFRCADCSTRRQGASTCKRGASGPWVFASSTWRSSSTSVRRRCRAAFVRFARPESSRCAATTWR